MLDAMANPGNDAVELLKAQWMESASEIEVPVDPIAIAKNLGIRVLLDDGLPSDVAGKLVNGAQGATIYLNAGDNPNRRRFTCAHELGHYVTRKEKQGDLGEWDYVDLRSTLASAGTDREEIYANRFAAALLMPAGAVRPLYKKTKDVAELAQTFGVSEQAMTFRLRNLRLA